MCGILGTIPRTQKNLFKKALDTLTHRGPDSYGIKDLKDNPTTLTLGHRRLSIVDLSSQAHQPMSDIKEKYTITFNGEIYNFLEIKKELIQKGHHFKSNSDTEVLLNAYKEWGEKCVLKFNGMWAFAIWDSVKKELFLSRDRFGKKPLFYAFLEDKFIFASEMKAIFPFLKELKASKDFDWMKKNILSYDSTDKCLIDGIKRFPAGHNAIFKNKNLDLQRYWNTLDHLIEVPKSYDEQVEVFQELFFDACKIRMRSDVSIGTALSGGLDSSATISAMYHISNSNDSLKLDYGKHDWQHAFVASFPNTPLDETKYAKQVVEHINIKANYVEINPLKEWENIYDYLYLYEELNLTSPIPMIMTYKAVKQNGVSVTLDGHGADELFSGYDRFLFALLDCGVDTQRIKEVLDIYQESIGSFSQTKQKSDLELYVVFMLKRLIKGVLGLDYKSKDCNHPNFKKLDYFSRQLYSIFHESILPNLLRSYDRYSMINGVEIRMPFMDHRIVSFVNSLPYSSKFRNGYTKSLIRDALDPYMPKSITWRKSKIGFNSPIVNWMQDDLKEWFGDIVHSKEFLESSFVDNPQILQSTINDIISKKSNDFHTAEKAWGDLVPYLWEKAVLKKVYNYDK